MTQIDLETLQLGGIPQLWIFVEEWGTDKSAHKDNDVFLVQGIAEQTTNDGKKTFPIVELNKAYKGGISEDFKLTAWALKSKEKVKASELIGKYIKLTKNGTRLMFNVLTDTEAEVLKENSEHKVITPEG